MAHIDRQVICKSLQKTKMCRYYKIGCKIDNCTFAHSIDEIQPRICAFGSRCNKKDKCSWPAWEDGKDC